MKIAIFYLIGGVCAFVLGWVAGHSKGRGVQPPIQDAVDMAYIKRLADRDQVLVRIKQLSREWGLTEFPDEVTAHMMELDLLAALVGGGHGPSDEKVA